MLGQALGETLGLAIGIAISPIPVAAVILMLLSGRARSNSVAFLIAWLAGIGLVVSLMLLVPGLQAGDAEPSDAAGWAKFGLGVLLLLAGLRQWRGRPGPDEEPRLPGWMARVDSLGPATAFGLGFALSALNPKNLLLAAAAGVSMGALGLSTGETVAAITFFTVIAALTVVVPVIGYLVAADRLGGSLDAARGWLIANNTVVMAVLFAVFGVSLVGDAVSILA